MSSMRLSSVCQFARSRLPLPFQLSDYPCRYHVKPKPLNNTFMVKQWRTLVSDIHPEGLSHAKDKPKLPAGPDLKDFLKESVETTTKVDAEVLEDDSYLGSHMFQGNDRKVYIETYGCQMNVNDTDIARGILLQNGFLTAANINEADIVLAVTCAIREGAEEKIWKRLGYFKALKKRRGRHRPLKIGILGCMAERLKHKILEREKMVDIVCGPDAYRDLPRLLTRASNTGQAAVNVQLSLEETYGDVVPVRVNEESPSAFVSIMRGCDNMCTYCIVPFTRGRERSRGMDSILEEVQRLSEQGVREVTLLGQNVNSYRDLTHSGHADTPTQLSAGFNTVYRTKTGGRRFAQLLSAVATVDPEMRIRFTSPHPKDFPDDVLHSIKCHANICNQLHLPAQSGNSEVLSTMGRGYTREAYLELVSHIRSILPGVALSSDFIAGFCGETESAHTDTLSLMEEVKYNFAFCFPYSMRQKTRAFHRLEDNVPREVKLRRNAELHETYRKHAETRHLSQVGETHLVQVEGDSRRSPDDLSGRNEANAKVVFPKVELPCGTWSPTGHMTGQSEGEREARPGEYVAVQITHGNSLGLKGTALYRTTLQEFYRNQTHLDCDGQHRVNVEDL